MRLLHRSLTVSAFALSALLVAACGNGGDAEPSGAEAPAEAPEAAPEDSTSDDAAAAACAEEFSALTDAEAEYSAEMSALMSGETEDPSGAIDALHAIADAAPSGVQGDFRTLADELSVYLVEAVDRGVIELEGEPSEEQLAELQELEGLMDGEALASAQTNIDTYFSENC
ncbi:MAG: hypothetical protein WD011_03750 [Nitriliruptoraceae bacterium]